MVPLTDDGIAAVTMPKWGLSMQLGKITAWAVAEGDQVQVGDDLADIETEKITARWTATDGRRLTGRRAEHDRASPITPSPPCSRRAR